MDKVFPQMEGLDYDKSFAHVARFNGIHIFLAYAVHKAFKVYQIDIKSYLLNGELDSKVYL